MKKLKVVALGGCGDMGRIAVKTLLNHPLIDEIIIADRNIEKARELANIYGAKTKATQVDIQDSSDLGNLFSNVDAVMNTTGPYFKYGRQVLVCAIDNECHYVDICDDWEPTMEMLDLDEKARQAGVTAVIGMGATPGFLNLIAVKAIKSLEKVADVYTGWNIEAAVSEPPIGEDNLEKFKSPDYQPNAAIVHGIRQLTGKILLRRDNEMVTERPIRKINLTYPGLGKGAAWTIGHPEPLTLPRYFTDIRNCFNVFVCPRNNLYQIKLMCRLVDWHLLSAKRAAIIFEKDETKRRLWEKNQTQWEYKVPKGETPLPQIFALATGRYKGKEASVAGTVTAVPPGQMGGATGVPLAIGLALLAEGKITRTGVFAPEGGIDPDTFFEAMAPYCEPKVSSGKDLLLMTKSWDTAQNFL